MIRNEERMIGRMPRHSPFFSVVAIYKTIYLLCFLEIFVVFDRNYTLFLKKKLNFAT